MQDLLFAPRAAVEAAQERNFAEMIDLVFERHPYYRALFAAKGLGREDLRTDRKSTRLNSSH